MAFVDMVNQDDSATWTAVGNHAAFHGLTVADMMLLLGRGRFRKQAQVPSVPDQRPDPEKYKDIPESWDWRLIDGGKYVTPVVEQASCGSCYAIAATDVANMKLRIASKGEARTTLSVQNVLSCSDYNQGCEGGYPLLVAKFAEDIGWVPDECQAYHASDEVRAHAVSASPIPSTLQQSMLGPLESFEAQLRKCDAACLLCGPLYLNREGRTRRNGAKMLAFDVMRGFVASSRPATRRATATRRSCTRRRTTSISAATTALAPRWR